MAAGATNVEAYLLLWVDENTWYHGETPTVGEDKNVHWAEILVLSFTWGVHKQKSNEGEDESDRKKSAGEPDHLIVKKYIDKTSPFLARECATAKGASFKWATLAMRKATGQQQPVDFLTIEMTEVMLCNWRIDGEATSEVLPEETLELRFTEVTFTYTPVKRLEGDGVPDAATTIHWDKRHGSKESATEGS